MWYNTGVNHIKSSGALERRRYPFSTCERGTDTMSDHTRAQQQLQFEFPVNSEEIPYGYCHCGCGQPTVISGRNDVSRGWRKGEPRRFLAGHNFRASPKSPAELFRERLIMGDPAECWPWQGALKETGYGCVWRGRIRYLAHRLSYELFNGPIADGLFVCHKCDNPPCVNPDHLFLGTPADNMVDKTRKGRGRNTFRPGELHPGAKLSQAQVEEILELRESGLSQRKVAKMYGIGRSSIANIWHGISYLPQDARAIGIEPL